MLSNIEIAQAAVPRPITEVAAGLGIAKRELLGYGPYVAKVRLPYLHGLTGSGGRLILVTAMSPTPAGEGKTTITVGLTDALHRRGLRVAASLREPSMGPVFGRKGGATGGGYAQVVPMASVNLHFTGDFAAIAAAHNLLAAVVDNHLHHGNALDLDARTVTWPRVVDLGDRALRHLVVGLGGTGDGVPRQDGFDIVAASEVMAVLCLTESWADLKRRLGDIVIGYRRDGRPVTARDLRADGAMAVLLRDALEPNLVQTLEGAPVFVHGGPFANIAHGTSSVLATRAARHLADYAVTEAGFGSDLGAEKFVDLVARSSGLHPDAAVVVATVRALKYHGGVAVADFGTEDLDALAAGMVNLRRHLHGLSEVFGLRTVVALNRFATDTDAEVAAALDLLAADGVRAVVATPFTDGGVGADDLAGAVLDLLAEPEAETAPRYAYESDLSLVAKAEAVATRVYGAAAVAWEPRATRTVARLEAHGFAGLPICIAKTPASFSGDATLRGAPAGHTLTVREVRLSAGAGFVVLVCGDVLTMPGMPAVPALEHIDLCPDGSIVGLS